MKSPRSKNIRKVDAAAKRRPAEPTLLQLSGLLTPQKPAQPRTLRGRIACVLCGEMVARGELLRHKMGKHGESQVADAAVHRRKKKRVWVKVVPGGLPTLGKRR